MSSSKSHFSSVLHNKTGGEDPGNWGGVEFILLSKNCHSLSLVSFSRDFMSRVKKEIIDLWSDVGSLEQNISFSYIKTDAEKDLAPPVICSKNILIKVFRDVSFIDKAVRSFC